MSVKEFIINLEKSNFTLEASDGKLTLKAFKNKVTKKQIEAIKSDKNIIEYIKEHKNELIDYVSDLQKNKLTGQQRPEIIPLSFCQERLWFIDRFEGSLQYHIPSVLGLKGKLNKDALIHAIKGLIQRHEVLRTVIKDRNGEPYQHINKADAWQLEIIDGKKYRDKLDEHIKSLINTPFDLSKDYMLRGHLIELPGDEYKLVITIHHIASDGWSASVLVKEVVEFYEAYEAGRPANLAPLEIQYADYAIWQRRYLQGEVWDKKISYWKKKLDGVEPLRLPADYERPAVQSLKGAIAGLRLEKDLSQALNSLSRKEGATLFMTLLAAFKVLLHRYSGQQDICVGMPIAGRQHKELEGLIGFFVNSLALRSNLNDNLTFKEFLQQIKETTLEAYEHQDVPFDKVVDEVATERDISRNPVFQVLFVVQNVPDIPEVHLGKVKLTGESFVRGSAKFDLAVSVTESARGLKCSIEYTTDLYNEQTIERMLSHYKELLCSIVKDPMQKIGELQMLTRQEEHQLLIEFNDNATEYPKNKSIVNLFEEQVIKTPGKIALVFEDEQLTYKELNERSNQLAHYLKSKGVKDGVMVPICIERSINMIVGILGILKAGGAYVPLDPEYPEERIRYMLEDTAGKLIISSRECISILPASNEFDIIETDRDRSLIIKQSSDNLSPEFLPHQIAYVIYTSGSTGTPKGVMVTHRNVISLVKGVDYVSLTEENILLSTGSSSFDATTFEYWGMLLNGGQLILCSETKLLDSDLLKEEIIKSKVNMMWFTSSWFNQLVDTDITIFEGLKTILAGGEKLSEHHIEKIRQTYPKIEIINGYGPTENTTFSLTYKITETKISKSIPIGRPLNNRTAYILNNEQQLVPVGVAGEIYLGGAGLSLGYLNRSELTREKFIENPFSKEIQERLYKTGDIGRWLIDGNIEYLGRLDDQVKIRGYRIELGEIEAVLNKLEAVDNSCVVVRSIQGNNKLVGYYILNSDLVKTKEHELYLQYVDSWKELYETLYSDTGEESADEEFNIIGWNDSFTGSAIPSEQMHEWLEDITGVILSEHPEYVLEIGCGTGLIYYQLAGKVKKYIGTDFSRVSIEGITKRIDNGLRDYGPTELRVCAAHEVSLEEEEKVDTIILNSIVQYFPGEDYLSLVLKKSISLLKGKGRIIIGDVRDNRLLELFKARLQMQKFQDSASVKEFKWITDQEVLKDEELCVSPEYFYNLSSQHPEITHAEIQWKQASYINELSLYRYTVIIYVGVEKEIIKPDWINWNDTSEKQRVINQLEKDNNTVAVKDVPNPRLWKERLLSRALKDKSLNTVGDILEAVEKEDLESIEVKQILNIAQTKGYNYKLLLDEDPLKVNIVFSKNTFENFIEPVYSEKVINSNAPASNIPLFRDINLQLQKEIRNLLKQSLPEYMIPSELTAISHLPITGNGKVDRGFLRERDGTESINKLNYQPPQTEIEKALAGIWQELLGFERIGIHDNFFEIGGDSIITIQVVSRARRLGYELKPKDIFIHQTISTLGAALAERSAGVISGEQGLLTDQCGLLPIQKWFFEMAGESVSHFNQSILLSIDKTITPEILNCAVEEIISHHDALRFRYYKTGGQWHQEYGSKKAGAFVTLDLKSSQEGTLGNLIKKYADDFQLSLDLEKGEIAKFVLIQTPENQSHNRILIVIHHLASDGVSMRILLEDLEQLLSGYVRGEKAELGNKSSSVRQWYEALTEYGQSRRLLSQRTYWEEIESSYKPIPVDKTYGEIFRVKDMDNHMIRLDSVQTQLLIQEVPRVYHTEINDILLCALAMTLSVWGSVEKVNIGLEGHGRENISESADISRTIGWFTNLYPVLLKLPPDKKLSDAIKSVKEQLRSVPDKGLGYGVLKYLNKDEKLSGKQCFDIVFNYLGQLDNAVRSGKWLSGAGESKGANSSGEQPINYRISINSMVRNGELLLNWSYNRNCYEKETISMLTEKYESALKSLITHCIEKEQKSGSVHTPSDFGLTSEISYEELEKFLEEPYRGKQRKDWIESIYRLSGLQEGMLFHGLYDETTGAYTEQLRCDLIGPDLEVISRSWNHILQHHSILRSGFYYNVFSIPVQCVYRDVELPVTILDYRDMDSEKQTIAIKEFEEADKIRGFDFKSVPLMRIGLIRLSEDRYKMIWTSHHILFDGWSLPILMEEFLRTYESLLSGKEIPATTIDRYEDYIRFIERGDKEQQEKYWRNYMKGVEQGTLLPFIKSTTQRTKGIGEYGSEHLELDSETTARIAGFAQKHRVTVNTIMQGVWSYLLHRYTGNNDVVFGIIVSGRPDELPGVEQRVGIYINTIPLHSTMHKEQNIEKWLQELQNNQVLSRQYQYTPLHEVQRLTGVSGDLFDSLLIFENYPVSKVISSRKWSLRVQNIQIQERTNYPLTILIGSGEKTSINFSYNKALLNPEYAAQIRDQFKNVLLQIIAKENSRADEIELLTESEKKHLLLEFNDTKVAYPENKTIIDFFEEQAAKNPDRTALVFEDEQLTYKELSMRSNQLANYLCSKGVKEETLVPICIERGIGMIVGILGILKSGGAFVPIDHDYPGDRIKFMIEDTNAEIIVASKKSRTKFSDIKELEVIELNSDWSVLKNQSSETLTEKIKSDQLAYVIFTSGSTGKPKGVMVEHRSLINLLLSITEKVKFDSGSVFLSVTTFSFDICYLELFLPLINGGKLVIVSRDVAMDGNRLSESIALNLPTHMQGTPSTWQLLLDSEWQNKEAVIILIGGEALKEELKDQLVRIGLAFNLYGPTETTIWSTIKKLELNEKVLIGAPLANTYIQILNNENQLVPAGVTGEIFIGGLGLARGYLNRKDLTDEKFITDPFGKENKLKIYRTGDLGRWLPDGNIEYLGRTDAQIKLRGYRIELGEIESILMESEMINQAVVLAHSTKEGSLRLVGYVVAEGQFNKQAIIAHLRTKLPEYMVPSLWVELESFPLTLNGKINRKALPDPDASELLSNEYVAPRNVLEEKLSVIWENLLKVEKVGIYDNFFELGGHSLLAMRLISAIHKELGIELAIKDLFQFTNISELSKYLEIQFNIYSEEKDSTEFEQIYI